MEFFIVKCDGRGKVYIDGSYQGESVDDQGSHVFQCGSGGHDVTLECLVGNQCQKATQRVSISETNYIDPMEVPFECAV